MRVLKHLSLEFRTKIISSQTGVWKNGRILGYAQSISDLSSSRPNFSASNPACAHPGRPQVMAQALASLPLLWETRMQLPTWAWSSPKCGCWRSEMTDRRSIPCLCLSVFYLKLKLKKNSSSFEDFCKLARVGLYRTLARQHAISLVMKFDSYKFPFFW